MPTPPNVRVCPWGPVPVLLCCLLTPALFSCIWKDQCVGGARRNDEGACVRPDAGTDAAVREAGSEDAPPTDATAYDGEQADSPLAECVVNPDCPWRCASGLCISVAGGEPMILAKLGTERRPTEKDR